MKNNIQNFVEFLLVVEGVAVALAVADYTLDLGVLVVAGNQNDVFFGVGFRHDAVDLFDERTGRVLVVDIF